jgi:hypothetical protein
MVKGHLPGDVYPGMTPGPEIMEKPPPVDAHGGAYWSGFASTNNFARFFSVAFGALGVQGEAKHGLWNWNVPGAQGAQVQLVAVPLVAVHNQPAAQRLAVQCSPV